MALGVRFQLKSYVPPSDMWMKLKLLQRVNEGLGLVNKGSSSQV